MKIVWVFALLGFALPQISQAQETAIIEHGFNTTKVNREVFYDSFCVNNEEKWYPHIVASAPNLSIHSASDNITLANASVLQCINAVSFKTEGSFTGFQNEKRGIKFGGVSAVADNLTIAPIIIWLLEDQC